jgi:hypothetical protein
MRAAAAFGRTETSRVTAEKNENKEITHQTYPYWMALFAE